MRQLSRWMLSSLILSVLGMSTSSAGTLAQLADTNQAVLAPLADVSIDRCHTHPVGRDGDTGQWLDDGIVVPRSVDAAIAWAATTDDTDAADMEEDTDHPCPANGTASNVTGEVNVTVGSITSPRARRVWLRGCRLLGMWAVVLRIIVNTTSPAAPDLVVLEGVEFELGGLTVEFDHGGGLPAGSPRNTTIVVRGSSRIAVHLPPGATELVAFGLRHWHTGGHLVATVGLVLVENTTITVVARPHGVDNSGYNAPAPVFVAAASVVGDDGADLSNVSTHIAVTNSTVDVEGVTSGAAASSSRTAVLSLAGAGRYGPMTVVVGAASAVNVSASCSGVAVMAVVATGGGKSVAVAGGVSVGLVDASRVNVSLRCQNPTAVGVLGVAAASSGVLTIDGPLRVLVHDSELNFSAVTSEQPSTLGAVAVAAVASSSGAQLSINGALSVRIAKAAIRIDSNGHNAEALATAGGVSAAPGSTSLAVAHALSVVAVESQLRLRAHNSDRSHAAVALGGVSAQRGAAVSVGGGVSVRVDACRVVEVAVSTAGFLDGAAIFGVSASNLRTAVLVNGPAAFVTSNSTLNVSVTARTALYAVGLLGLAAFERFTNLHVNGTTLFSARDLDVTVHCTSVFAVTAVTTLAVTAFSRAEMKTGSLVVVANATTVVVNSSAGTNTYAVAVAGSAVFGSSSLSVDGDVFLVVYGSAFNASLVSVASSEAIALHALATHGGATIDVSSSVVIARTPESRTHLRPAPTDTTCLVANATTCGAVSIAPGVAPALSDDWSGGSSSANWTGQAAETLLRAANGTMELRVDDVCSEGVKRQSETRPPPASGRPLSATRTVVTQSASLVDKPPSTTATLHLAGPTAPPATHTHTQNVIRQRPTSTVTSSVPAPRDDGPNHASVSPTTKPSALAPSSSVSVTAPPPDEQQPVDAFLFVDKARVVVPLRSSARVEVACNTTDRLQTCFTPAAACNTTWHIAVADDGVDDIGEQVTRAHMMNTNLSRDVVMAAGPSAAYLAVNFVPAAWWVHNATSKEDVPIRELVRRHHQAGRAATLHVLVQVAPACAVDGVRWSGEEHGTPPPVSIHLVVLPPPGPPAPPLGASVVAAAKATAVAAGVASGAFGSPVAALQASRASFVSAVVECFPQLDRPLDVVENPTGLAFGDSRVRYYLSAITMNVAFIAGTLGLHGVAGVVGALVQRASFERGMATVLFPSLAIVVVFFTMQNSVTGGTVCLVHGDAPAASAGLLAGIIVLIELCIGVWYFRARFRQQVVFAEGNANASTDKVLSSCGRAMRWLFVPTGAWLRHPLARVEAARHFGIVFERYTGARPWFSVLELVVSFSVGVLDGVRTVMGCGSAAAAAIGVYGLYIITLVGLRPHAARADFALTLLFAFLQLVSLSLAVAAHETDQEEPTDGDGTLSVWVYLAWYFSFGSMFILSVRAIYDVTIAVRHWCGAHRGETDDDDEPEDNSAALLQPPAASSRLAAQRATAARRPPEVTRHPRAALERIPQLPSHTTLKTVVHRDADAVIDAMAATRSDSDEEAFIVRRTPPNQPLPEIEKIHMPLPTPRLPSVYTGAL